MFLQPKVIVSSFLGLYLLVSLFNVRKPKSLQKREATGKSREPGKETEQNQREIVVSDERDTNLIDEEDSSVESYLCRLHDFFVQNWVGDMPRLKLMNTDHPAPLLIKLMRDIVFEVAELHDLGIVHGNLNPRNVFILNGTSLHATISVDITTGSGGSQTYADDLFALGSLLFFCNSCGKYLFCTSCGKYPFGEDNILCDSIISKNVLYLSRVHLIPEAVDIISRLLDPSPNKRPRAAEVLHHPLFWDAKKRLKFIHDASSIVDEAPCETRTALLKSLSSVSGAALDRNRFDTYNSFPSKSSDIRPLNGGGPRTIDGVLRYYHKIYENDLASVVPRFCLDIWEETELYLRWSYPRLLFEVYKVMSKHACQIDEKFVGMYLFGEKRNINATEELKAENLLLGSGEMKEAGRRSDEPAEQEDNRGVEEILNVILSNEGREKHAMDHTENSTVESFLCSLHDLFVQNWWGSIPKIEFMSGRYPASPLIKLMRDIVSRVAQLHHSGIVHGNLKPQNVLIFNERPLCAKLSVETAAGYGNQTYADDLFAVGCLLFFCMSRGMYIFCTCCGKYPFGKDYIVCDFDICKCCASDLIPAARDIISRLLDPSPDKRPSAVEVLHHPLLWDAETQRAFQWDVISVLDEPGVGETETLWKSIKSAARTHIGYSSNDDSDDDCPVGSLILVKSMITPVYNVMSKYASEIDEEIAGKYFSWVCQASTEDTRFDLDAVSYSGGGRGREL